MTRTVSTNTPLPQYLGNLLSPIQAIASMAATDGDTMASAGAALEGYSTLMTGGGEPTPESEFMAACAAIMQDHAQPDIALVLRDLCDRISFQLYAMGKELVTRHGALEVTEEGGLLPNKRSSREVKEFEGMIAQEKKCEGMALAVAAEPQIVDAWVDERCTIRLNDATWKETVKDLYEDFERFCVNRSGIAPGQVMSLRGFGTEMTLRFKKTRFRKVCVQGVKLKPYIDEEKEKAADAVAHNLRVGNSVALNAGLKQSTRR